MIPNYTNNNKPRVLVLTKTIVEGSAKKVDEAGNQFRQEHDCIATDTNVVVIEGTIMFVQTIYYRP